MWAVRYSLFAVRYWLLAVGCWLLALAIGCWLFGVGCWLLALGVGVGYESEVRVQGGHSSARFRAEAINQTGLSDSGL